MPIHAFKDRLELATLPDEDRGRYQTLSGMMMWLIGKVPRTGDSAEWAGWRLEVVDLDGNRIDKVLAVRLPEPEPAPEGDADAGAGGSEA
jgi:putative hemolysin